MSTEIATNFGVQHADPYGKVLSQWSSKLKGVEEVNDKLRVQWGSDLQAALAEEVTAAILKETVGRWKKTGTPLPSDEALQMFAGIAAKGALAADTGDLLQRLRTSANLSVTAGILPVSGLIQRAFLTVAQIFDMAQDRFNWILDRFLRRKQEATGRRRWVTSGANSRHRSLNGQVKKEGQSFVYNGQEIHGPRPPGGSPADWSNCSCYLQYETGRGNWV